MTRTGLTVMVWLLCTPLLRADGGTVQLSERQGGYQVTVFTAPAPLRVGPVDVSVLVQHPDTGAPIPEAQVTLRAWPRGRADEALCVPATEEAATNKLFRAAVFDLPEPGRWEMEVSIEGPFGEARVRFEAEAAEPLPRWLSLWPWYSWPFGVIVLFGIHQGLKGRPSPG